tara:strand:- start:146 stop:1342 length:1197 start_codon:yes stop_codon:yes gene_type:complete
MSISIKNLTEEFEKNINRESYTKVKFSDLVENIVEKVVPKTCGLKKYIGLKHLDTKSLKIRRFGSASDIDGDKLKAYKGDFIFAKRNSYLKRVAIIDFEAVVSAHALVLRVKPENVNPDFLPFFMMSETFWTRAIEISVGSLSPTINWKVLAKQEFMLPSRSEQDRLVEVFKKMSVTLDSYWEVMHSLEKYKRKVAYDCYYSSESRKVNLEDLCVKIQDGSHFSPQTIHEENSGDKFRYVTSKNIRVDGLEFKKDMFVDEEFHRSIYKRCDTVKGDLLLTKDGANTGTATINSLEQEISLLSSVCLIRSKNELISNEYICHYINSDIGNLNLTNQMTGTAITRLTLTTLRKVKIPVHSKEVMDDLVIKLNYFDDNIRCVKNNIHAFNELQKSLIEKVF